MTKKVLLGSSKHCVSKLKQLSADVFFVWSIPQRRTVGIYNNPLLKALYQLSANIWVERAVHIQESMGLTRGKTDQVDAKPVRRCGIALFAYKNREEARLWNPPRTVIAQLDRLTAQRARLVKVIK